MEEKQRLIEEILQLPHQVDGDDDDEEMIIMIMMRIEKLDDFVNPALWLFPISFPLKCWWKTDK